jgi:hypothetical protein
MFHQSIRYFRPDKILVFRNSTGEPAYQWRNESRPIVAPRTKSDGSSTQEETSSGGDPRQPSSETRRRSIGGNSAFRSTAHVEYAEDRSAVPREQLRQVVTVSGSAKLSTSPSAFHRDIQLSNHDPTRHNEVITGVPLSRYNGNQAGKRSGLNKGEQSATGIGQPDSDTNLHTSNTAAAMSTNPPPGIVQVRSFGKTSVPRNSVSQQVSLRSDVDRATHDSAKLQNGPALFGTKASRAIGKTPATFGNHSPAVANAPVKVTRQSETGGASAVSGNSDFGRRRLAHLADRTILTDQSSTIAGELWLDTMSLREWLQAYLTQEMRHASQAANRPGVALA